MTLQVIARQLTNPPRKPEDDLGDLASRKNKQAKMHQNQNKNTRHEPVLLSEVLKYLAPRQGESYLDLTAGYGGHADKILAETGSFTTSVLVDRDQNAAKYLQEKYGARIEIRQQDFLTASRELLAAGRQFDLILADLGVSSPHLNEANRGFAINQTGPLDMRMDSEQSLTASDIVNGWSEDELARILKIYGEEPKARQIANAIIKARPVKTTSALADIVKTVWPGRSRVHPATRTFQAIRIVVNDELTQLSQALPIWIKLLNPGGRLTVISFHSLEDRIVKQVFAENSGARYDSELKLLTKRPIEAEASELVFNPRARSAKLRAAVKIKKKGN